MAVSEDVRQAFSAIRANTLRTVLTVLIIAFGIMALVGILTSIDALKASITSNFSALGANTFSIRKASNDNGRNKPGTRQAPEKTISYFEAQQFQRRFTFPATVSISSPALRAANNPAAISRTRVCICARSPGIPGAHEALRGSPG